MTSRPVTYRNKEYTGLKPATQKLVRCKDNASPYAFQVRRVLWVGEI